MGPPHKPKARGLSGTPQLSYITTTYKGENVGRFGIQNLLTVGGEGWSTKEKLLTVVDGSSRGRV